jgi:hypothetical protein
VLQSARKLFASRYGKTSTRMSRGRSVREDMAATVTLTYTEVVRRGRIVRVGRFEIALCLAGGAQLVCDDAGPLGGAVARWDDLGTRIPMRHRPFSDSTLYRILDVTGNYHIHKHNHNE